MTTTFKIWLEAKLLRKELISTLLKSLDYTPDALEKQDIKIDIIPPKKLRDTIERLPIDEKEKEKLRIWILNHPKESLRTLVHQINPLSIKEKQDTAFTYPAVIPQGNRPAPHPLNPQQQMIMQQQQQKMG